MADSYFDSEVVHVHKYVSYWPESDKLFLNAVTKN